MAVGSRPSISSKVLIDVRHKGATTWVRTRAHSGPCRGSFQPFRRALRALR
jgi:hypothetical protein